VTDYVVWRTFDAPAVVEDWPVVSRYEWQDVGALPMGWFEVRRHADGRTIVQGCTQTGLIKGELHSEISIRALGLGMIVYSLRHELGLSGVVAQEVLRGMPPVRVS
jgi:hypothetical protein